MAFESVSSNVFLVSYVSFYQSWGDFMVCRVAVLKGVRDGSKKCKKGGAQRSVFS